MHTKFDHKQIEQKWQKQWREDGLYTIDDTSSKEKMYVLDMFPYPSGEGLHVGHPKGYIATDVFSRFKTMSGYEVLHPMGWDAFGLPAENFAIQNKVHPRVAVGKNIENFKEQLGHLGFNYDWSREVNTTDPAFYKWTQWIFLKLYEKGLAYESYEPINWCPSCQTGLANEDLEADGTCERCDSVVEKKPMRQWVLKITDYADRMLEDLETLTEWPAHIKEAQRNWIGRSNGAEIKFKIQNSKFKSEIEVFTTRPDTLFGATYLVLAPEHPWVRTIWDTEHDNVATNKQEIAEYVAAAAKKTEIERQENKEKTGVRIDGISAINPANGEEIPIFVADYVLAEYGTGAIMAVPAHDERDFEFAQRFDLPIRSVVRTHESETRSYVMGVSNSKSFESLGIQVEPEGEHFRMTIPKEQNALYEELIWEHMQPGYWNEYINEEIVFLFKFNDGTKKRLVLSKETEEEINTLAASIVHGIDKKPVTEWLSENDWYSPFFHTSHQGTLINSGAFDGMDSEEAKRAITEKVGGAIASTYRLNDWVFSRQRYWGEPIPIIHCEKCGAVPVPEDQLPVTLPEVEHYAPTGTGESPLADIDAWVNTACPKCDGAAKRETNTMPQWAGSSWYYLRFVDPQNDAALIDPAKEKDWLPVDVYVGGDHAVRHLIYARFWHKFLYDIGVVSSIEPFTRLEFLGFILAEDGRKMSKRWGNVINPNDIVEKNGADALRVYEMFMGPFENTVAWSTNGLVGAQRFLERVYGLENHIADTESESTTRLLHKTIKKVTEDIESFKFNTAISAMMIFINTAEKEGVTSETYGAFIRLLAPFAPHITEELWHRIGNTESVHAAAYPEHDPALVREDTVTIGVQVNGKVRGDITIAIDAPEEEAVAAADSHDGVTKHLAEGRVQKVIYVPGRILNFIVQ